MATMRDIKRRIKSIQSTQQITKAMKMVAAAKLRKTQGKVVAARPYADQLGNVMQRLLSSATGSWQHPLLEARQRRRVGYVVVTADRGLCGAYNVNAIRLAEQTLRQEDTPATLICLGRKGRDYFRRRGYSIDLDYVDLGDEPNFIQAREMARQLVDFYQSGVVDELVLIYNEFISALHHQTVAKRFLPLNAQTEELVDNAGPEAVEYIYEPSPEGVLSTLLPRYVETQIYRMLLEAKASEHGARMTAMDAATSNAGEIIQKLTLTFNRARQAMITKEISEIVGGAEALK